MLITSNLEPSKACGATILILISPSWVPKTDSSIFEAKKNNWLLQTSLHDLPQVSGISRSSPPYLSVKLLAGHRPDIGAILGDPSSDFPCVLRIHPFHVQRQLEDSVPPPALAAWSSEVPSLPPTLAPRRHPWVKRNTCTLKMITEASTSQKNQLFHAQKVRILTILAFRLKRLCWSQRRQTVRRMPGRTFPSVAASPVKFAVSICVNGVTSIWSSFRNMSQIPPKRIALAYWPEKLTKKLHFQFCPAVRFSRLHNCMCVYIYSNIATSSLVPTHDFEISTIITYLTWTLSADLEDIERCKL